MKRKLITSALPYVNNVPHLGNIIGSVLPGDVINRYYRHVMKNETLFICGADEYGTCTEMQAIREKKSCRDLCNKYYKIHKEIYDWFGIKFDHFGRTSTKNPKEDLEWSHTKISQDIFIKLANNDNLIEKTVKQLYSPELQTFVSDRYVTGICPKCKYDKANGDQCDGCGTLLNAIEIINPIHKLNPKYKLDIRRSDHLFLDLSKFKSRIKEHFNKNKHNWSISAIRTTEAWLNKKLQPRCITRDLKWGTPVPNTVKYGDKYKDKVFYCWFDAPIGYISITQDLTNDWERWWKNNKINEEVELIQIMGVDNVIFHSIIFPISLIGTGENYTLINRLNSSYYLNYKGGKFSKSQNRGVFGTDVMEFGIDSDVWRYYLLSQRPENKDTEFNWKDFLGKNKELIGGLGNIVHRILSFTYCKFKKVPPIKQKIESLEKYLIDIVNNFVQEYHQHMQKLELKKGLIVLMKLSRKIQNYMATKLQPWYHINIDIEKCKKQFNILVHMVGLISKLIYPFMPRTSSKIEKYLNSSYPYNKLKLKVYDNIKLNKPEILFNKIDEKYIDQLSKNFN